MLTKQQLNIFRVFRSNIFANLTFKEIKGKSGQKSNSVTQMALKQFLKMGLVSVQKTADISTYGLNLGSNITMAYLNIINDLDLKMSKDTAKIIDGIKSRLLKHSEFFVLIIFGSYAKNKATAKSDLDIAVIVESDKTRKEMIPLIETIKRREIIEIDYHVITRSEFLEMLKSDEENLAKQIFRESLIYYGLINYYNLIKGVKHEQIS